MVLRKGSLVKTKHGEGKIQRIDRTTYSIPLFVILLTSGRHKGEKLALTESQFYKL